MNGDCELLLAASIPRGKLAAMTAQRAWCVWVSMLATGCAAPAQSRLSESSPSAANVLGNVQRFYAHTHQVRAQFREVVTTASSNSAQTSDGIMMVSKPSRVRFDYIVRTRNRGIPAVIKTVIFDGSTLWDINHRTRRIVQTQGPTANVLPAAVSFLTEGLMLHTQFDVSVVTSGGYGTKNATVLELTPKRPHHRYKHLVLVVEDSDWHVSKSIVTELNGDTTELEFYAPSFKALRDSFFQVSPASLPNYQRGVVGSASP